MVKDTSQNMKLTHRDPNNETKCEGLYTGLDLISHIINLLNMSLTTRPHLGKKVVCEYHNKSF